MFSLAGELRVCGLFAVVDEVQGNYEFAVATDTDVHRSMRVSLKESLMCHPQYGFFEEICSSEQDMWTHLLNAVIENCDADADTLWTYAQAVALGLIDNCGYDNVLVVRGQIGNGIYDIKGTAGDARSKIEDCIRSKDIDILQ